MQLYHLTEAAEGGPRDLVIQFSWRWAALYQSLIVAVLSVGKGVLSPAGHKEAPLGTWGETELGNSDHRVSYARSCPWVMEIGIQVCKSQWRATFPLGTCEDTTAASITAGLSLRH